ncbi:hypothetical protein GCM10007382_24300 [Salinibacterium xinjiangense]|uniref:Uncharacterized protein n=1 Tax=Salinibacterium xinjiangense TaxID=386302 RepID=A0A2C9A0Z7_9MICO|nr:DUF6049 family protein [Salinibacterium xinjiangense]GGL03645.1 hypothetical protein GCM10007382_24300 [Salinibacterium xinjiangense]SOE72451.1 hypothetical protein SAMN06296378_2501 [Salinibacterium xinjiangense]
MSLRVLSVALAFGIGLVGIGVGAPRAAAVDPAAPVQVAIAVPIIVPESAGGLISADALTQYTSPLGTLTRQLDSIEGRPVVLGIDPRIIVSIRILGTAAPASASAWLARLEAAPNESFPLTYADSDITLASQAGSTVVLQPTGFDFAIDPALFTAPLTTIPPTPTGTPTPTAAATPTAPVVPPLPSSQDLESWQYSLTGIAWPVESTVTASDLPIISSSGFSTMILSSANLDRTPGSGAVADVTGTRSLVADATASASFRSAVQSFTVADWQANTAAMSSAISTAGQDQSGSTATVVITLDRNALDSGNRLADTITAVQGNPRVRIVGFTELLGVDASPATVIDQPHSPDQLALMRQLLEAQTAEAQFAAIAEDPLAITSARRLDLLALQSSGWRSNPAGWPVIVTSDLVVSTELRSAVQVASTGDFNFLAAAAPLPIAVANNLDQPVTVYVTVRPDTGLLTVGDTRIELEIEPNSQASAMIPAQAVSNGVVGVTVSLSSASGVPIGESSRARINVQAGWETPIVIVIASLVVAVFGGGLVRNILRLRKAAAAKGSGA